MSLTTPRHRCLQLLVGLALALSGACSSGTGSPTPEETEASSGGVTTDTTSQSTTTAVPTGLSPDQAAAYGGALDRWASYERATEPVWARGLATAQARLLFQEFFVAPVWKQYFSRLQTYEDADVKIEGLPTVYWSEPGRVRVTGSGGSVTIRQCVDYSTQTVTQGGRAVDAIDGPVSRTATLDKAEAEDGEWLLLRIVEPTVDDFKTCGKAGP